MQPVRPPRSASSFVLAAALALALAFTPAPARVGAQTAPGAPAVPGASAIPAPQPSPPEEAASPLPSLTPGNAFLRKPGQHRQVAPKPSPSPEVSPTPTSPAFATLDGTWEVQVQHPDSTDYSYITLKQGEGGVLSGVWSLGKNKAYPLDGTYDGRLIKLTVKEPEGDVTFSGYVETASDMVGLVDYGAGKGNPVAFTAEHRGKPKGLQNIRLQ